VDLIEEVHVDEILVGADSITTTVTIVIIVFLIVLIIKEDKMIEIHMDMMGDWIHMVHLLTMAMMITEETQDGAIIDITMIMLPLVEEIIMMIDAKEELMNFKRSPR
jgi:membrane-bound acyltransferase YfiQ involved in biofilm formation